MPITKHEISDDGRGSTRYRYWALKDGERHIASCDCEADADRIVEALANTWIKCSERMPTNNDTVFVCRDGIVWSAAPIFHNGKIVDWESMDWVYHCPATSISHWMPAPKAPTPKGGA